MDLRAIVTLLLIRQGAWRKHHEEMKEFLTEEEKCLKTREEPLRDLEPTLTSQGTCDEYPLPEAARLP
jgi:hypothetical protein